MKTLGCDLHAKQQTVAMVDTETGEITDDFSALICTGTIESGSGREAIRTAGPQWDPSARPGWRAPCR
jgi:hypothetical protein